MDLQIIHYPHPALFWKSVPIQKIDQNLKQIVETMFELMYEAKGIGLAANQVALPYRLFIINLTADPEQPEEEMVFINPRILKRKGMEKGEEGCLSLPELFGPVNRSTEIVVEGYDLEGKIHQYTLNDLAARAVQHEYDHIDGIMFIDRMTPTDRQQVETEVNQFVEDFRHQQSQGDLPDDDQLKVELKRLSEVSK